MRYPVIIVTEEGTPGHGVIIPDFPSAFSGGDTVEEAIANVQDCIETALEPGDPIPTPSRLGDVLASEDAQGEAVVLVDLDMSFMDTAKERVNITVPAYALALIDQEAAQSNTKRSAWIVQAALDKAHANQRRRAALQRDQVKSQLSEDVARTVEDVTSSAARQAVREALSK